MLSLRTTDWIIQLIIGICSLLVMLISTGYAMWGEFILGVWQLLSALLNTYPMYRSAFRKRIMVYWVLVVVSILFMISGVVTLMMISLFGSWLIAIYYCVIYRRFIDHLLLRQELSTVIRH